MSKADSKKWKWQSATIFATVLIGAVASIVASAGGCGPNDILINNCPDSGASDGGDGGGGEGAGGNNPYCD